MFNPKENLLEQQLAVSGLEMQIFDLIGAGLSIFGAVSSSNQASQQNAAARRAEAEQKAAAKEAADATNKYNAEAFAAEKQNYFNNKAFKHETAVKNWKYQQSIRDFEYSALVNRYAKSVQNTEDQLIFNSIAAVDAYEAEQASLNEITTEDIFNRQGNLVDRLEQEGEAALGQAGVSRNKRIQSRLAGIGRNSAIADASLASSVEQSQRNMRQIAMDKYGADLQARASMMIRPEPLPAIPEPIQGPDAIFVEPIKATPTYIPAARQVSTTAPLVAGFGSAASSLSNVNWNNLFGNGSSGSSGGDGT